MISPAIEAVLLPPLPVHCPQLLPSGFVRPTNFIVRFFSSQGLSRELARNLGEWYGVRSKGRGGNVNIHLDFAIVAARCEHKRVDWAPDHRVASRAMARESFDSRTSLFVPYPHMSVYKDLTAVPFKTRPDSELTYPRFH